MADQRMTTGISVKLGLLVGAVTVLAIATVVILTTTRFHDALVDREVRLLAAEASEAAARYTTSIVEVRHEVRFIRSWPALHGLLRAHAADGQDPETGMTEQQWKSILQEALRTLVDAKSNYVQARIVVSDGRELVRVNRDLSSGAVHLVPDSELIEDGDRPYFQATAALDPDAIHVAPIEFIDTQRHGDGAVAVQRVATSIRVDGDTVQGVVVIALDVRAMAANIAESVPGQRRLYIISGDAIMPASDTAAGSTARPGVNLESVQALVQRSRQQAWRDSEDLIDRRDFVIRSETGQHSIGVARAVTASAHGDPMHFVVVAPYDEVVAASVTVRNQCVLAGLILLALSLSFGGVVSSNIVRPLRQMVTAADRIADGRAPGDLPVSRRDEAGALARSLQRMYDEIQGRTTQLQQEIDDRRQTEAALERTNELLRQSNGDLQQFAYVASHDLQEPLRMVTSYLQLLERRYEGQFDNDGREFIGFAVEGARRMRQLISDLLDFSRVDRRHDSHTAVETTPIVQDVLTDLSQAIRERGAIVTVDGVATVWGDPVQLRQVLQNIVSNAIKFSEQAPRVHISIRVAGEECTFAVRDNGIGIGPEYVNRVFVIFQRLHERTKFPGTGMGLAVAKRIVERHHGRIWVESSPGEGTTVSFTIPTARETVPS